MTTLAERQRAFAAALLDPREPPLAAAYRRNLLAHLAGALAAAYPVVRRLVGDAFFFEAARRHALEVPSRSGDLHAYGGDFAGFLAAYPHAAALAYLPHVARLEWAVHESQFAADAPAFDFRSLAAVPAPRWPALRFRLAPAVRLLRSAHPVVALWEANQPGRDGTPQRVAGPDHALVHRQQGGVRVVAESAPHWEVLRALSEGRPLEQAAAPFDGTPGGLAALLAGWASRGVLCGFDEAP